MTKPYEQGWETGRSHALWGSLRATSAFLLAVLELGSGARDNVDTVLLIAIVQSNVAAITGQPDMQAMYAGRDPIPPDSMRRPITISALAASVSMPFETVRRRDKRLAAIGLCEIVREGVRVPVRAMESQYHDRRQIANYELVKAFYRRLRAARQLDALIQDGGALDAQCDPPIRAVARISYDFLLNTLNALAREMGDLLTAICLITVIENNIGHLPADAGWAGNKQRRPVPVSTIASQLAMSETTVRRRLLLAFQLEWCRRGVGGVIVPDSALHRPSFIALMDSNRVRVSRMFYALDRLGVLRAWAD